MSQPDPIDAADALDALLAVGRRLEVGGTLSRTAAYTLATLATRGPVRLTDLAEREAVSQPAMTGLVKRLQASGLAARRPDPSDGRAVLVEVTARGRALVEQRREAYARLAHDLVDRLDDDDRATLDAAAPTLVRLARLALDELPPGAPDPRGVLSPTTLDKESA